MVGSGLSSSLGSGCSFPSSQTRLPSLRKGKESVREESGERSGVPEGDVRRGAAMFGVKKRKKKVRMKSWCCFWRLSLDVSVLSD